MTLPSSTDVPVVVTRVLYADRAETHTAMPVPPELGLLYAPLLVKNTTPFVAVLTTPHNCLVPAFGLVTLKCVTDVLVAGSSTSMRVESTPMRRSEYR